MSRGVPEAVRRLVDRQLSADDFKAWADAPLSPEEVEEVRSLVAWFTGRYPSAEARLAYVRKKYAEWTRSRGAR